MTRRPSGARATGFMLLAVLALYGLLVLPTIDRQGVNWDEETDIDIARVYSSSAHGLLHGSRIDAINTRLPMYSAGLLYRLSNMDRLILARWLSVVMAAVAVAGAFVFCLIELDRAKAVVAAVLLATNPYFLFFGKQALSEGDVWISAAFAWFLVAYAHWRARPGLNRAALVGLALGLALSSKISALALLPALLWAFWKDIRTRSSSTSGPLTVRWREGLVAVVAGLLLWLATNLAASAGITGRAGFYVPDNGWLALGRLLVGGLLALGLWRWIGAQRGRAHPPSADVLVCLLATVLAFFLLPPVHTTNPWILASLGDQFLHPGSGPDWTFWVESAAFHLEVVVLKSSPFVGVGLLAALVIALVRRGSRPALRLPLAAVASYFSFLLLLPWAQTRYMMPLLVPLVIFAADAAVDLYRTRPAAALLIGGIALVTLGADLRSCYPDLNLNGHPWVGERYLTGRSTVGYRSIVHTPSDGIEQSLRWLAARARPEQTVATVYLEHHVTRAVLGSPPFQIRPLGSDRLELEGADWVITSLNYDIVPRVGLGADASTIFRYPHYDRGMLVREFEKVFTVTRAFDIEVASVWKRRDASRGASSGGESRR